MHAQRTAEMSAMPPMAPPTANFGFPPGAGIQAGCNSMPAPEQPGVGALWLFPAHSGRSETRLALQSGLPECCHSYDCAALLPTEELSIEKNAAHAMISSVI